MDGQVIIAHIVRNRSFMKIAITGTIAAGKTTVAILFRRRGIPVFNADQYAKRSLYQGSVCYEKIKEVIRKEVAAMTELEVVEVNVTVTDIKTKEQQKEDDVSIQDRVTSAAQTTGKFTSEQVDKVKDKVEDNTDKEARVK